MILRDLGPVPYEDSWVRMQAFTEHRTIDTTDELWLLEHPPVYTLGLNDRREPFDNPDRIPIVSTDRGGQITYHGPGQLIVYVLMDLRRRGWGVRRLVQGLEQAVLDLLESKGVYGERRAGAPGIYVSDRKIAQLGLRVRRGGSYHGLSLNVAMDLSPFQRIKPCGYAGLETVDLKSLCGADATRMPDVKARLVDHLVRILGYNRRRTVQADATTQT